MNLTGTSVRFETIATSAPDSVNVAGSVSIGTQQATLAYTDAPTIAYSLAMLIQAGVTLTMDMETGAVTGTVAGTNQVETATIVAAAGATTAGNLNVTVTSSLITGSPLLVPVALVLADDTAAKVAAKVRTALGATAAITAHYTVSGTGADYVLTAIEKAANDATLNMGHASDGTLVGITTAATSADTTGGVGISRAYKVSGTNWNNADFEGVTLPTMSKLHSMLIRSASTAGTIAIDSGTNSYDVDAPFVSLTSAPAGDHPFAGASVTFAASDAPVTLTLDIHAGE